MSKLDYFTIAIVVVCVTALIYLVVSIMKLKNDQPGIDSLRLETPAAGSDDEGAYVPDESGAYPDAAPAPGAIDDYDPDDDEVEYIDPGAQPDETAGSSVPASEPPPVESAPSPPAVEYRAPASGAEFLVLAGSYRIRDNADTEVRKLQRLGYANAEVTIFNRGTYATVLVERFENADDARAMVKELKSKHGIDSYVQRRRAGE